MARRAVERDEAAVANWVKATSPQVTTRRISIAALACYKPGPG
ncbi:hypothetical protein [Nocardia sp. NPDC051463]